MKTIVATLVLAAAALLAATVNQIHHDGVRPAGDAGYIQAQGGPPPCGLPGLPPCPPKPPHQI